MKQVLLLCTLLLLCPWSISAQTAQATPASLPVQSAGTQTPAQANSVAPATSAPGKPVVKGGGGRSIPLPPEKASPTRIPRLEKPPVIDGKMDEAVWQQAVLLKDFYEIDPGDNVSAAQATEVRMGYDAKTLYIGFHCYDEPGKVRATIPKRDDVYGAADDSIRVFLDTYNDQRKAYVLVFNPLGVQQDGIRTEGAGTDFSVDIVMESKGTLTSDGYIVEVAIPFKSLRYAAGKDKLWGLQIFRQVQHRNNETDSWMPLSRDISGTLNQEGHITGLEGLSTERTFELIPSLTLSENGKRVRTFAPTFDPVTGQPVLDPGRTLNQPLGFDPGLTAKLGITPTITLDATLNPDFAQVEADAPVVLVNQRFPIFFQEKRPFFLEGKDVFLTPITALHTRAIVDPDYAVKLTGKQGRNTFGLILASDNAPGNFSNDDRQSLTASYQQCLNRNPFTPGNCADPRRFFDKNAYIGVLRLKRDFGKENTLGVLATSYNFIERHNDLGGFDGRYKFNPKTVFTFQVLGTTSRRRLTDPFTFQPGQHTLNGFGYNYNLDYSARHWGYNLNGVGFTRGYRADVGFTQRNDNNNHQLNVRWNTDPQQKGTIRQWRASLFADMQHNFAGHSQRWDIQPFFGFNMPRQTFITFGYRRAYERLFAKEFGLTRFFGTDDERSTYKWSIIVDAESQLTKKFYFFTQVVRDMHVFDFDFGAEPKFTRASPAALLFGSNAPLDPGPGNLWNIQAVLDYKASSALHTSLNYTKQQLVRNDTHLVAFDDNIYSWRTTYQFTRFTFTRVRLDYDTIPSQLRVNALVGWTPNPGTAFYVGYNDDLTRNGFSPFTGQLEPGFRRNGRQFFVKMSYLFRRSI